MKFENFRYQPENKSFSKHQEFKLGLALSIAGVGNFVSEEILNQRGNNALLFDATISIIGLGLMLDGTRRLTDRPRPARLSDFIGPDGASQEAMDKMIGSTISNGEVSIQAHPQDNNIKPQLG